MRNHPLTSLIATLVFCIVPFVMFGQHNENVLTEGHQGHLIYEVLEWLEFLVDIVGIGILCIGFAKGFYFFLKMEMDNITGSDTFDDILALRSTLGGYIILALDFLIISDIIHSVIKPDFNELINLGIIVVLRTSIGFFLGRELMEMRHSNKKEAKEKTQQKETPKVEESTLS